MGKQLKYWHIAYIIPGQEGRFAAELNSEGILCFFAVKLTLGALGKRKVSTMFPGYVFFHGSNAERFFTRNSVSKWKGYLYTLMAEEKENIYYMLDNQVVLDLINKQMNGGFDFTKPALIGVLRVGDEVTHTIPENETNHLKGSGTILERNRKTATLLWGNRVVKISLCFLRKKAENLQPSERESSGPQQLVDIQTSTPSD